jgi:hypothetical protein
MPEGHSPPETVKTCGLRGFRTRSVQRAPVHQCAPHATRPRNVAARSARTWHRVQAPVCVLRLEHRRPALVHGLGHGAGQAAGQGGNRARVWRWGPGPCWQEMVHAPWRNPCWQEPVRAEGAVPGSSMGNQNTLGMPIAQAGVVTWPRPRLWPSPTLSSTLSSTQLTSGRPHPRTPSSHVNVSVCSSLQLA